MSDIYNSNSTMRLIGRQEAIALGDYAPDIEAVITPRISRGTVDFFAMAADAFAIGYIRGKQAERARKAR